MEQTFKSPDFVLRCSAACSAACWEPAHPPAAYLPLAFDSLLHQSYLSESGCFSVSRIAVLLFDLLIDFQVFAIFR